MIIAFTGRLGSGKTLGMSIFGTEFSRRLEKGLVSSPGYSLQKSKKMSEYGSLWDITDKIICIDELHNFLDSRNFSKNMDLTHWILQIRHLDCDVLFSTQILDQVDNRIRRMVNYEFHCRFWKSIDRALYTVYDCYTNRQICQISVNNISQYFNLYNTKELVTSKNLLR